MESGFENGNESFAEKFSKYSYSDQWIKVVADKIKEGNLGDINTVVFIRKRGIENPISVSDRKFTLHYIGQIEYDI